jgi:hypothetical protein
VLVLARFVNEPLASDALDLFDVQLLHALVQAVVVLSLVVVGPLQGVAVLLVGPLAGLHASQTDADAQLVEQQLCNER